MFPFGEILERHTMDVGCLYHKGLTKLIQIIFKQAPYLQGREGRG